MLRKSRHCITLLILFAMVLVASDSLGDEVTLDPHKYLLQKFNSYDIVFLGTKHKQLPILNFLSELIPTLKDAGVSHICLEIPSNQQEKINRFMRNGDGLSDIEIWSPMDCPEYRKNVLATIQSLPIDKSVHPVAIDLPRSRFSEAISRDEYMAQRISELLKDGYCKKVMVVLGNLHILKYLDWEDHVKSRKASIREYLSKTNSGLKMFSVAQVIGKDPEECDFTKKFSALPGAVAVDCTGKYQDWKLGVLAPIAIKETGPCDVFDGLIVY